ncbi:hypothetical protein R0J89_17295, partial [Psychrobacter sp. SIMBA_152]
EYRRQPALHLLQRHLLTLSQRFDLVAGNFAGGTSPVDAGYNRFGSINNTGFLSKIALSNNPFASYGLRGVTILIPGVCAK